MSVTSVFGRRHPPIAFRRQPASRCNPSRSTSTPSFADHAATRRDDVGCDGRCPPSPGGAVPARSLVASLNAGSSRSAVASLSSRRHCAASSSVRARCPCDWRVRRASRLSGSRFARNFSTPLRLSRSRPVSAPRIPVIRSRLDPIPIDLLKLNAAFTIFTADVLPGKCWRFL